MSRVAIANGAAWLERGSKVSRHARNIREVFFILAVQEQIPGREILAKMHNCDSRFIKAVPRTWTDTQNADTTRIPAQYFCSVKCYRMPGKMRFSSTFCHER